MPHSSACCTGRPPPVLHHSVGSACAWCAPCWSRVACALRVAWALLWLMRVACAPAGDLRCTLAAPSSFFLPTAVLSEGRLTGPNGGPLGAGSPRCRQRRSTKGPRVGPLGARSPASTDSSTTRLRGPSGGPLCAGSPGHKQTRLLHCRGPRVGPLGARPPVRTDNSTGRLTGPGGGPLGARSPGRCQPRCGLAQSCQRWQFLVCQAAMQGHIGWGGGGGVGGPLVGWGGGPGRPWVGYRCCCRVWFVVPLSFPSPSRLVYPWWAPPHVVQTAHMGCGRHPPPNAG